jgi:hypothetical protein
MQAHWSDLESSFSREIHTAAEALSLISELRCSVTQPAMVEFVIGADGLAFGYAVGRERTVLAFQYSNEPPYYLSQGDSFGDSAWFCYAEQYSEYPGRNMISHAAGKEALKEFFATQELPTVIKWERL